MPTRTHVLVDTGTPILDCTDAHNAIFVLGLKTESCWNRARRTPNTLLALGPPPPPRIISCIVSARSHCCTYFFTFSNDRATFKVQRGCQSANLNALCEIVQVVSYSYRYLLTLWRVLLPLVKQHSPLYDSTCRFPSFLILLFLHLVPTREQAVLVL